MAETTTSEKLIGSVRAALALHPFVHALWLEGSAAAGHTDSYSDIDVWADVDAGAEEQTFTAIRRGLLELGPLELEHPVDHPHPQIKQRFYRLEGVSPYLFLDVCLQQHGRGTVLPVHEPFKVLYDPEGIVRGAEPEDMRDNVLRRLGVLRAAWWRRILVLKEVERGRLLEALGYYHSLVLEPLTELLRLRYCPEKHDYGLKHIHRDLPAEVVRELETLYSVATLAELPAATEHADALFDVCARRAVRRMTDEVLFFGG